MRGATAISSEGKQLLEAAVVRADQYFKVGGMNVIVKTHFKYLTIRLHDRENGSCRKIKCSALISDTLDTLFKLASIKLNDLVDFRRRRLN